MYTTSRSVRVLQRMREAKGNPSYARIAEGVNGVPSKSSIERMFRGETIPTLENARVVIQYLEGNIQEYVEARNADGFGLDETDGEGPIPPQDFRTVATAADLNRLSTAFTNTVHEHDEINEKHINVLAEAYSTSLEELRKRFTEQEARHSGELRAKDEAHAAEIRALKEEYEAERESYERALLRRETFCYIAFGVLVLFFIVWIIFLMAK